MQYPHLDIFCNETSSRIFIENSLRVIPPGLKLIFIFYSTLYLDIGVTFFINLIKVILFDVTSSSNEMLISLECLILHSIHMKPEAVNG